MGAPAVSWQQLSVRGGRRRSGQEHRMRWLGQALAWAGLPWLVLVAGIGIGGCAWKGELASPTERQAGAGVERDVWRPEAVRMRVYPLTEFERKGDELFLHARIELFDEMGDAVKASGVYRLTLLDPGGDGGADPLGGDVVETWEIAVQSLAAHRKHYDGVTRTYRFRLTVDAVPEQKGPLLLDVVLTRPDGSRLQAEAEVPMPAAKASGDDARFGADKRLGSRGPWGIQARATSSH